MSEWTHRLNDKQFTILGSHTKTYYLKRDDVDEIVEAMFVDFPKRYEMEHPPGFGEKQPHENEDFSDEVEEWLERWRPI